jgi:hypothetical protein
VALESGNAPAHMIGIAVSVARIAKSEIEV